MQSRYLGAWNAIGCDAGHTQPGGGVACRWVEAQTPGEAAEALRAPKLEDAPCILRIKLATTAAAASWIRNRTLSSRVRPWS
jgi:hypothetical protein